MKHLLHLLLFLLPLASFSQVLVRDVFDFAVGDTFQRVTDNPGGHKYVSEIVTDRRNYYPDSIVYTFYSISGDGPTNTEYIETSIYSVRVTKIDTPIFAHQRNSCGSCNVGSQYTVSHIGVPNYVMEYSYTGFYSGTYCQGSTSTTSQQWLGLGLGDTYTTNYTIGQCFNTGNSREMIFYRKANGATYGTPHNSLYTSISSVPSDLPTASLLPNPSSGHFTLTLSQQPNRNTSLRLYSFTGQLLSTHLLQNEATNIDVSTLPKGIYMWQLEADGKTIQNGKLIMQ